MFPFGLFLKSLEIAKPLKTVFILKTFGLLIFLLSKKFSLLSEKEQQRKKAKKDASLAKGNFIKKKAEVEKLSGQLQSAKGK